MMDSHCSHCQSRAQCKQTPPTTPKQIALVGNPNCGKTSLYNVLTGDCQRVGNFPGITVNIKKANFELCDVTHTIVDLPGVYSLEAFSRDEEVTAHFLNTYTPDLIINVIDASNIERNLYLTAQLSELNVPMVIALNMVDVAHDLGIAINVKELSKRLNVPIVSVVASHHEGIDELTRTITEALGADTPPRIRPYHMSHELEEVDQLEQLLFKYPEKIPFISVRWTAIHLLMADPKVYAFFQQTPSPESSAILTLTDQLIANLTKHSGENAETAIMEGRYAVASGLSQECVRKIHTGKKTASEYIDEVVCHRFWGIFIMLGLIYALFAFVFAVADELTWLPGLNGEWVSPTDWISGGFDVIKTLLMPLIPEGWATSLVEKGIIDGLSGVFTFVPVLFMMFFFISFFEDSGYISRVSFILDRFFRIFGLQGKSILSFVMAGGLGPGCAVPAIMSTRTLRDEKDRLITMFVSPIMICGAKMPILLLFTATFFPSCKGTMVFVMWMITWIVVILSSILLSHCLFKGEATPFVMELPIYHVPRFRGMFMHAWHNTWLYIQKAGTIILALNIGMWALMYFPQTEPTPETPPEKVQAIQLESSYGGFIGKAFVPIMQFAGMDWRDNIALLGGAAAKEVTYSTLATTYAMSSSETDSADAHLQHTLTADHAWNPVRAFAFLIFFLIYAPCTATLYSIYRETKSKRWTLFALCYPTVLAYVLSVIVYQVGTRIF